jgi:hypothetical protein
LGFEIELTPECLIKRLAVIPTKGGVRSNALIEKYQIKQHSPIVSEVLTSDWGTSLARDKIEYGLEAIETGFTLIDFEDFGTLNLLGLKKGDVRFKASVTAPAGITNVCLIEERIY